LSRLASWTARHAAPTGAAGSRFVAFCGRRPHSAARWCWIRNGVASAGSCAASPWRWTVARRPCWCSCPSIQARLGRGGRLQISVRDNGAGVPAGLERQIFLPFFSAREGGQGIGLTVVRQLVYGMGGRVRHVRPLEGGAAFVLSF
jgi:hypothetical protein